MQSGSYWAYRDAGAFCEEYDPDEPERRTRCICGAFLTAKPTFEGGVFKVRLNCGNDRHVHAAQGRERAVPEVPHHPRHLPPVEPSFQARVRPWVLACFGEDVANDRAQRAHRFAEEALELVQAIGGTAEMAHRMVDYVFSRPLGEPEQEIGGVMTTLATLCLALGEDMHACGEAELARVWTKVDAIRAKRAGKPDVLATEAEP